MAARAFVDTNVLVYAFDSDAPGKQNVAREILGEASRQLVVSTQVLTEFYVVVTRKLARPLDAAVAARVVDELGELPVVGTDLTLVRAAMTLCGHAQISYWDALIIEAAAAADCDAILTEDLATGTTMRGVEIVNPFS